MTPAPEVDLVPLTRENWREAVRIRVAEGQLSFVADHEPVVLVIVAKAFLRVADLDWWPFMVRADGVAVGVAALVDERPQHRQLALFHLLIDADRQGRGYGRASVRAFVALARQAEGCDRLRLTVHPDNARAVDLYRSEGFDGHDLNADGELQLSTTTVHPHT